MRKKTLLLMCCLAFMMLSSHVIFGQQGVLLPEKQAQHVHDENCTHDHETSFDELFKTVKPVMLSLSQEDNKKSQPSITPRRGDISNPNYPDFDDIFTIQGPDDVNVIFGAGESSAIISGTVEWPGQGGTVAQQITPAATNPTIFLGSKWAKNAVISFADQDGFATGELFDIKFYNNTRTQVNGGTGTNSYGWGGPDMPVNGMSPQYTAGPNYTNGPTDGGHQSWAVPPTHANAAGGWHGGALAPGGTTGTPVIPAEPNGATQRAVRLYLQNLEYDPSKDVLRVHYPLGYTYTGIIGDLHTDVWNSLVSEISGTTLSSLDNANAQASIFRLTGISTNGTIFSPVQIPDPTNSPFGLINKYDYYLPIFYHLSPYNININTFSFNGEEINGAYTSTRDNTSKDDGEELIVRLHGDVTKQDFADSIALKDYFRPTTLLISETNTFDSIAISDVEWYVAGLKASDKIVNNPSIPFVPDNRTRGYGYFNYNCAHFSGYFSYQRDNYQFDTTFYNSYRYVDAAVRLLDNANVCVVGNVTTSEVTNPNILTNLGKGQDDITSAVLVLPGLDDPQGRRSNFRLKIGGDANILHTQDSGSYVITPGVSDPLYENYLYSDSTLYGGPGPNFPREQVPIWLSGGGANASPWNNEVVGMKWDYLHPREPLTLTDSSTSIPETQWVPFASTEASVYGVWGDYFGATNIHTQDIDGVDTTNIIEIGPSTANQDYFKIYSGGMLKNFRSDCSPNFGDLVIGTESSVPGVSTAPGFYLSRDPDTTLYIIYDGDGSGNNQVINCGGIVFNYSGVDSINDAIANAAGGGDLHIQSLGYVKFMDNDPSLVPITLDFTLKRDNEVKILSDQSYIHIQNALNFMDADSAHLTIWANGSDHEYRGNVPEDCESGSIVFDKEINIEYEGGNNKGKGLVLIRSAYDDIFMWSDFSFTNIKATDESGELMVQAGQDIRIYGKTDLVQDGARSMLFEARKTIALGEFNATMGNTMVDGDLTIKAGYGSDGLGGLFFLPTADVSDLTLFPYWNRSDGCVEPGYRNRDENHRHENSGGDIWFKDSVKIILTPEISDSIDVFIRAYNSIYVDGDYQHTLMSNSLHSSGLGAKRDTTLTYAETGNYEAINSSVVPPTGNVVFNFSANDSVYFLLQAGNTLGNPCGTTECDTLPITSPWHGNVLFGNDKAFTINHDGVGPTLISASRDIENQVDANFTFTYTNPDLSEGDSVKVTAGRHIETHAPYWFDFSQAGKSITNNITMQAGHLSGGCDFFLCKAPELATNLAYNYDASYTFDPDSLNEFAAGGKGNGSILLFDSLKVDYSGTGNILLTALNGNIESDPYLHGIYKGGAPIIFNVDTAEGVVRMEAIDIKLHDILEYSGYTANALKNGQFQMAAFDSILTRNISYTNQTDTGSVFITSDKHKPNTVCGESDYTTDQRGIHQGHIVLGYVSDCDPQDTDKDVILFDFSSNPNTEGANLLIQAGYLGYYNNPVTGINSGLLDNRPADRGKGYGGNITFDFMKINMALGDGNSSGYAWISTPNGNIWGKDSLQFHGIHGNLRIDAGAGSLEDTRHAVRWASEFPDRYGAGSEDMLNTKVPFCCDPGGEWRTGNIMLKGGSVDFMNDVSGGGPGSGNVFFRTREGFIDIYDRFNATNMTGHLLIYAGITPASQKLNEWGDVSQRDFQYTPVEYSGSVYFGADDNIMLNYGYSNGYEPGYQHYVPNNNGIYNGLIAGLIHQNNPFYSSEFPNSFNECYSIFNVNTNGYLWYKNYAPRRQSHLLYRGCEGAPGTGQSNMNCSPLTGECYTVDNGARPLTFNFNKTDAGVDIQTGGLAVVASNYIDMFTAFTFEGGSGAGIARVPEMNTLKGERVEGYGLYIKSLFNGATPENRRNTCFLCSEEDDYNWKEWPVITFHDDARIHTQGQKSLIEAPVIEFFGHAFLDAESDKVINRTKLTVKADSLIFHDSAIFAGQSLEMLPFTTDSAVRHASKESIMRYGVVNDDVGFEHYLAYGKAIEMPDRGTPVLEFGYQRCYEPPYAPTQAPNRHSKDGKEPTPMVGGDVIVAFKYDFALPIYNTIVANHARISFIGDLHDGVGGGEYVETFIRTDLLRIRNKVEFYTDPDPSLFRLGTLRMTSNEQMPSVSATGIYPRHLHMEPGSELSIPDEDSLIVISTTTVGGYGNIHENVHVLANGIIAPGYASLMEQDCQTGFPQGRLSVHNLYMEKDAILRVSMRFDPNNCDYNPDTKAYDLNCTRMDTLSVNDSIFFFGRIEMHVLVETEYIEPGCYLFMEYNDTDASVEYVQNLVLMTTRHNGLYLTLDKSERGRIYLCVTELETPTVQRYVLIHEVEGVKTDPVAEIYHYVQGHQDFVFNATYTNKTALEVLATGYYSQRTTKLPATYVLDGIYEYRIRQVVEPYDVYFGDIDTDSGNVINDGFFGKRVWAYRNTLFINVDKDDVVSIYNVTGVLYQKLEIPAGLQKLTLDRGVYMVTLKNGTVHKIIIN